MRVGIVGLGKMGRNHARVLGEMEGFEPVGFVDPNVQAGSAPLGVRQFPNIQELGKEVDYAVISTPSMQHVKTAVEALNNGLHCIVEKPLTHDVGSAEEMAQAALRSTATVRVGMVERFNPAVVATKTLLRDGQLGGVLHIRTLREGPRPSQVSDIGADLDLAVHDVDLVEYLLDTDISQIACSRNFESSGLCNIFTAHGAAGTASFYVDVNWVSPSKRRSLEILTEKALLVLDLIDFRVFVHTDNARATDWVEVQTRYGESRGLVHEVAVDLVQPLRSEHADFARCIQGQDSSMPTVETAKRQLTMILR